MYAGDHNSNSGTIVLTQGSELAVRSLVLLALERDGEPRTPRWMAERMDCSASYLSKVLGSLTRVGILTSVRGARGGVLLAKNPIDVSLLEVVEACDGFLVANYCRGLGGEPVEFCGFHVAMKEIHDSTVKLLSEWTLEKLLTVPVSVLPSGEVSPCKMAYEGCERHLQGACGCAPTDDDPSD